MPQSPLLSESVNWMIRQQLPQRQSTLRMALEALVRLHSPPFTIVECGTMRNDDWVSDGRSTLVFEALTRHFGGQVISLDISAEACGFCAARTDASLTKVVCRDASSFLKSELRGPVHLLYLDSLDVDFANPQPAAAETRRQFDAAVDKLAPGALVLIDDSPQSDLFIPHWYDQRDRRPIRFPTGKGAQLLDHPAASSVAQAYQLLLHVPSSTQSIPRTIHHVFGLKDEELPAKWRRWLEDWMRLHPSFEHRMWNGDDCRQFVAEHDPSFLDMWRSIPDALFVVLADYVRLLIVLKEGGLYLDCDIRPLLPIDPLMARGIECVLFREGAVGISNAAFGAIREHSILAAALQSVRAGIETLLRQQTVTNGDILRLSGPNQIKRAAIDLGAFDPRDIGPARRDCYSAAIQLFARKGVLVCPEEAMVRCRRDDNWFATHCANGTWRPTVGQRADMRDEAIVWRRR